MDQERTFWYLHDTAIPSDGSWPALRIENVIQLIKTLSILAVKVALVAYISAGNTDVEAPSSRMVCRNSVSNQILVGVAMRQGLCDYIYQCDPTATLLIAENIHENFQDLECTVHVQDL